MSASRSPLTIADHCRERAGLTYVYPVVSRRARGVSIGINLNVNNACNWACVYCQVPGLTRGGPPPVDLGCLERELRSFLVDVVDGSFMEREVPVGMRVLQDVAFSGNGEPTAAAEFAAAVDVVAVTLRDFGLTDRVKIRLITNGSLMHRVSTRQGVAAIGRLGGEVWFKVDRATPSGVAAVNQVRLSVDRTVDRLGQCALLAKTWVQTCWFAMDGAAPGADEEQAYLELIGRVRELIAGVHLYGLARPSMQPAAPRIETVPVTELERLAARIQGLGVRVTVNP